MLCVRLQLKNESRKGGTATTMVDYRGRENGPMYERETRLVPPRAHDSVISIPNNRRQNSRKITRNCISRRINEETMGLKGIPGL